MRKLTGFFLIGAGLLFVAACGDEEILHRESFYTGLWRTQGFEGSSFLFELEQIGDSLAGSVYTEDAAGARSAPKAIREGTARGDVIRFTIDSEGEMYEGAPVDTLAFRGTRRTEHLIRMEHTFCTADTCLAIVFDAVRGPSGF
ncbi:MAG: hypothetical protein FJY73_05750 [Candidatus Eisenbacteria bacterium]|nr:hypothetical protein [Candidatus Eisenbacteria bacterium]